MSEEKLSLFAPPVEPLDFDTPSVFPDLTASQNFSAWVMPVNSFAARVASRPEYYNLDPRCLVCQTLAHITGAAYFDTDGPTRKKIISFISSLCRKMNPDIDSEIAKSVSDEVLRAIDNRQSDRDLKGEAFESRSFDAKSGKWVESSFRLVECQTNAYGQVCYRPTSVAYAILSLLVDISAEDRAALQARFIADIAADQKRMPQIETMLEGFVASLREIREKLNGRMREFCRKVSVEKWHSDIVPLLDKAGDLIQRIRNDVARISSSLLSESGEGKVNIAALVNQVNAHWNQLVNKVENAPYEYERMALKTMRLGDKTAKNTHDLMLPVLQTDMDLLNCAIDDIFSCIMPATPPPLGSFEGFMRIWRENNTPEIIVEQPVIQRKYSPLKPIWTNEEIEGMREFIIEKILNGSSNMAELLEYFDEPKQKRLVVHLVFGLYVSGMLKDLKYRILVEDTFTLENMEGDSFAFSKEVADA